MNRTIISIAIVLGLIGVPRVFKHFAGQVNWQQHVSTDGRYSVDMPAKHTRTTEPVPIPGHQLMLYYDSADLPWGAFAVGFCDYPESLMAMASSDLILDGCAEGWVQTSGAKMRSNETITLQGRNAREMVAMGRTPEGQPAIFHARVFLDENRLYVVQIVADPKQVEDEHVRHFYDSFKLN